MFIEAFAPLLVHPLRVSNEPEGGKAARGGDTVEREVGEETMFRPELAMGMSFRLLDLRKHLRRVSDHFGAELSCLSAEERRHPMNRDKQRLKDTTDSLLVRSAGQEKNRGGATRQTKRSSAP
jgi:hypothetical protein